MTRTFWATADDPLAIVNGSFRRRSIAMYSRKSIRVRIGHHRATKSKVQSGPAFRSPSTTATRLPRPLRLRIESAEPGDGAVRPTRADRSPDVFPGSDETLVDVAP